MSDESGPDRDPRARCPPGCGRESVARVCRVGPDLGAQRVAVVGRRREAAFDRAQARRVAVEDGVDQGAAREAEHVLAGEDRRVPAGAPRELGVEVQRVRVVAAVAVEQRLDRERPSRSVEWSGGESGSGSRPGPASRSPPKPPSPVMNMRTVDVNAGSPVAWSTASLLDHDQRALALVVDARDARATVSTSPATARPAGGAPGPARRAPRCSRGKSPVPKHGSGHESASDADDRERERRVHELGRARRCPRS